MAFNKTKKVEKIPIEEILMHNNKIYLEDASKARAVIELRHYVNEFGAKNACRQSGFVVLLRALNPDKITRDLVDYIKSRSYFGLRGDVHRAIYESDGDEYSSPVYRGKWKKLRRGLFSFYYYDNNDYVNVFSIPEDELPLYVNFDFDKDDKEIYLKRMRGEL